MSDQHIYCMYTCRTIYMHNIYYMYSINMFNICKYNIYMYICMIMYDNKYVHIIRKEI